MNYDPANIDVVINSIINERINSLFAYMVFLIILALLSGYLFMIINQFSEKFYISNYLLILVITYYLILVNLYYILTNIKYFCIDSFFFCYFSN